MFKIKNKQVIELKSEIASEFGGISPYKVVRKDGTVVVEFSNYSDALEFSNKLNTLYFENNIKDISKVISSFN